MEKTCSNEQNIRFAETAEHQTNHRGLTVSYLSQSMNAQKLKSLTARGKLGLVKELTKFIDEIPDLDAPEMRDRVDKSSF